MMLMLSPKALGVLLLTIVCCLLQFCPNQSPGTIGFDHKFDQKIDYGIIDFDNNQQIDYRIIGFDHNS